MSIPNRPLRFLVIRRDNIGDLICTTPIFQALRERYPDAKISALVNTYNATVLDGNPFIDHVYTYLKAKHRPADQSVFNVYLQRLRWILELRREKFDYVILATPSHQRQATKFARIVKAKHVVGYVDAESSNGNVIDIPIRPHPNPDAHEVERVYRLLEPLNISSPVPPLYLRHDPQRATPVIERLEKNDWHAGQPLVAVHISSRVPSNRWPVEKFAPVMRHIWQQYRIPFLLLWAPGEENNPTHPGDDGKARQLLDLTRDLPVSAYATANLSDLIAALATCTFHVCLDGGAMHIGAALGKPTVCIFGGTNTGRWRPWGVPKIIIKSPTNNAMDVTPEQVAMGFDTLWNQLQTENRDAQKAN